MKKLLVFLVCGVMLTGTAFADSHYQIRGGVVMKHSVQTGTPSTQMAKQLSVMYSARPGLWLGMQVCPTEDGDEVGGPAAELRLGTLYTTKAGTKYDVAAYGYWDANGSAVDGAFDIEQGSLGLSVSLIPVGAKWSLQVFGGADGYTDVVETLVRINNDKTDPEYETVITSELDTAFELGFSMGFRF